MERMHIDTTPPAHPRARRMNNGDLEEHGTAHRQAKKDLEQHARTLQQAKEKFAQHLIQQGTAKTSATSQLFRRERKTVNRVEQGLQPKPSNSVAQVKSSSEKKTYRANARLAAEALVAPVLELRHDPAMLSRQSDQQPELIDSELSEPNPSNTPKKRKAFDVHAAHGEPAFKIRRKVDSVTDNPTSSRVARLFQHNPPMPTARFPGTGRANKGNGDNENGDDGDDGDDDPRRLTLATSIPTNRPQRPGTANANQGFGKAASAIANDLSYLPKPSTPPEHFAHSLVRTQAAISLANLANHASRRFKRPTTPERRSLLQLVANQVASKDAHDLPPLFQLSTPLQRPGTGHASIDNGDDEHGDLSLVINQISTPPQRPITHQPLSATALNLTITFQPWGATALNISGAVPTTAEAVPNTKHSTRTNASARKYPLTPHPIAGRFLGDVKQLTLPF